MTTYSIDPLDRLFFRDNSSFDMEMSSNVRSIFPPYPSTVVGMARTMMALSKGWDGEKWGEEQKELVGTTDDLKGMQFRGPYLDLEDEIYLPVPKNLVKVKNGEDSNTTFLYFGCGLEQIKTELLNPSEKKYWCNLSDAYGDAVSLPQPSSRKFKTEKIIGFVNLKDMEDILNGNPPKIIIGNPWSSEVQVGNRLSDVKTTSEDNSLFTRTMIRPHESLRFIFEVTNGPEIEDRIGHLGGETRLVSVKKSKDIIFPEVRGTRTMLVLITHTYLGNNLKEILLQLKSTFGTKPITACMPNPVMIGGWDYLKCEPKPLLPYLVPGTVFYFDTALDIPKNDRGIYHIGGRKDFGFGQYLIGKW